MTDIKELMLRPMKDIEVVKKLNPPCADSCYTVENLRGHFENALEERKKYKELYESITNNFTHVCHYCNSMFQWKYREAFCPMCGKWIKAPASESLDARNARLAEKAL